LAFILKVEPNPEGVYEQLKMKLSVYSVIATVK
jgi:hypothetical protein